ncbi:unnamed protein product [Rhodiola kirilowii]
MSVSNFIKHVGRSLLLRRSLPNQLSSCSFNSGIVHNRRQILLCIPSCSNPVTSAFSTSSLPSSFTSADTLSAHSFASPYLSARIQCPREILDEFCESLLCFGANSTSVDEIDNHEANSEVCITCTFSESQDVDACISLAARSVGLNTLPSYSVEKGEQYEWIKKTQESFHPVQIIEGVWIVPEWQIPPVTESHAMNIILNPGLAFGTGEHPTTKLCLLQLHKVIKAGDRFLDYGTGSGVLAIASLKFGAASCVGVDIDPLAIASACQNAALNNIGPERMQLLLMPSNNNDTEAHSANEALRQNSYCKDAVLETNKYDVVIANILLNPLLDLAESIVSYAKPGATIALSGVLIEQIPQIIERYSSFMDNMTSTQIDDYACITGRRMKDVHT